MRVDYLRKIISGAFGLALLHVAARPAVAQGGATPLTKPVAAKWRPKAGPYAMSDAEFGEICRNNFGDIHIDIPANSAGRHEELCKIVKLRDTAPGAVTLDLSCTRIDNETPHKETLLVKKTGETSIFIRMTVDGKFLDPGGEVSYCPEDAQEMYLNVKRMDKKAKKAKELAARQGPNPLEKWRPKDGVYAEPDASFNDRCLGSGKIVVELAEGKVSNDEAKCSIFQLEDSTPGRVGLNMICNGSIGADSLELKRIDNTSISLTTVFDNNYFKRGSDRVSYCSEEAQRIYTEQKAKK